MNTDSMKDKQPFQLINGTFTPSEASRILLSLVKSKMDYHGMEKHSNEERLGMDPSHSAKRLNELAELQTQLIELIAPAANAGRTLRIKGWIEITAVE